MGKEVVELFFLVALAPPCIPSDSTLNFLTKSSKIETFYCGFPDKGKARKLPH